jgi:hypothetical protein
MVRILLCKVRNGSKSSMEMRLATTKNCLLQLSRIVLVAAILCSSAQANLINVTTVSLPDLATVAGDPTPTWSQPLAEKSTSQGDNQLFSWVQGNVPVGDPKATDNILANGTSTALSDLSSYVGDYLVVHWGNGDANAFFDPNPQGGYDEVFLIMSGGLGDITLSLPSFTGYYGQGKHTAYGTKYVGGLSFWRVYEGENKNDVPDGGSAAMLLSFAVASLEGLRRKTSKA